jgi:membrane-bound lytic murein transglycosylase B
MMRSSAFGIFICAGIVGLTGLTGIFLSLQPTQAHAQAVVCDTDAQRTQCQSDYNELQKEIAQWQQVLDTTRQKKSSLQGDVTTLNAQIKQAQAQIAAKAIAIAALSKNIDQKTATIKQLTKKIDSGKESLAALVRQQDQLDQYTAAEVAFSSDDVSTFFSDLDAFVSVEKNMQSLFSTITSAKNVTEAQRSQLSTQQTAVVDAEHAIQTQKQQVAAAAATKQQLLAVTASQETQYSQVLAERQAKAAAIKAALFKLRDSGAIEFGTALTYAQAASAKTGVRPALILAFLSQESDLGANVGSCYVTNITTGDGKGKNTGTPFSGVMKAPRDTVPFQAITAGLGREWSTTPVSCPQPGGYGGALGPAQFIPSTWKLYTARLIAALGVSQPDPWSAKDAIMANALYIADLGAGAGTYTAERNAACKYFSGQSCPSTGWIAGYGDSVVAKANNFQQNIDFLNNNK